MFEHVPLLCELLTLLQEIYWHVWFLFFIHICLTGGILTCVGMFGVKLVTLLQEVYCHAWFLLTQICLTGGILTCFGMFGVRECFRWSTAMLMSCLLKHIRQVIYSHVLACLESVLRKSPENRYGIFPCFEMSWRGSLEVKYFFFILLLLLLAVVMVFFSVGLHQRGWCELLPTICKFHIHYILNHPTSQSCVAA